jgi:polyphenol oxidase
MPVMTMSAHLLTPDWPAPAQVRSACSLRTGGVSLAPYDSLNLGDHVGDDPAAVAENRRRYAQLLGAQAVYLQQVHGVQTVLLSAQTPHGTVADACITAQRGLACTIMVADCLPVLFCHRELSVVGAAHAGWRGLCGSGGVGVLEQCFAQFYDLALAKYGELAMKNIASQCLVWLGPCIGPQAFEVGPEVRQAFLQADPQADACFAPWVNGKFLANLPMLARQRLARLGLTQVFGNDGSPAWCTVSQASHFFSHRRDRVSGRFAASIWLA